MPRTHGHPTSLPEFSARIERAYALGRFPFELACAAEDPEDPEEEDDPAAEEDPEPEEPEEPEAPEAPEEEDDPAAGRPALVALSSGVGVEAAVGSGATSIPIRRMLW